MHRWWVGRAVTIAVVGAVLSPALRDRDSFPLSTYPVYASARGRTSDFGVAFGETADGQERRLSMQTMAATDDPLIAADRIADAIAAGGAQDLCERIAQRAPAGVVVVVVAIERHDTVDAARGEPSLIARTVHARCPTVPR